RQFDIKLELSPYYGVIYPVLPPRLGIDMELSTTTAPEKMKLQGTQSGGETCFPPRVTSTVFGPWSQLFAT
ncbi:MAG: hypothetical protein AAGG44_00345, partial [Planctomycetota bacterium]